MPRERPDDGGEQPLAAPGAGDKVLPRAAASPSARGQGRGPDRVSAEPGPSSRGPTGSSIARSFSADFSKGPLEPTWNPTSPAWKVVSGRLCAENAKNHPIWLTRRLPVNARIEFTAESADADGDIKVEAWGDGKSYAETSSYTATSYVFILGGWQNRFHVLARLNEHGPDRRETALAPDTEDPRARQVVPNQVYRFKIERRDGATVRWYVDDVEIHALLDEEPLRGPGHEHFAFNDWTVPVCFDDLVITALDY